MHGHGTLLNGACDVYEGEWKDGVCLPGPGVLTLRGGDRFVGTDQFDSRYKPCAGKVCLMEGMVAIM